MFAGYFAAMRNKALYLSLQELETVIHKQEFGTHCERDRAILYLCYYTGLRAGEVSKLTWRDLIEPHTHQLRYKIQVRCAISKGNKGREVYLVNEKARSAMRMHMQNSQIVLHEAVFQSQKGGAFSAGSMQRAISKAYRRAGSMASSHSGRRSFATNLLQAGANIFDVKELLGHACISTTQKYLETSPERLQAVCGLMA